MINCAPLHCRADKPAAQLCRSTDSAVQLRLSGRVPVCCALQGHTDTVEDVVFQPGSASELASVADDTQLLFWDTRSGSSPVIQLNQAHSQSDLHVVDWSSLRSELVATG